MRRRKLQYSVALAVFALVAAAIGTPSAFAAPAAATGFTDVPRSQQFYGDITWLASQNITTGNGNGTFGPTQPVNREQMAAFLYRFANPGKSEPACSSAPFPDVPVSNPFCGYILWLRTSGVTTGNANGTYSPLVSVGRGEMAAFMFRIRNSHAPAPCQSPPFPDVPVSSPFCGDITWLVAQGVTGGFADGDYHPAQVVAREAMAAFLHRLSDPAPAASAGHYVRTTGSLQSAGAADATADAQAGGAHLHLLDIGAQSTTAPLSAASPGVVLTTTSTRMTYAALVSLIETYLNGFHSVGGVTATVAVGTNSDGCFSTCAPTSPNYLATAKGTDWWTKVIAPLRSYAALHAAGITVIGANDIEPGFAATPTEAAQWEQAYTAAAGAVGGVQLVFNGSADGCPQLYGQSSGTCNNGWTESELAALASGTHVAALPQIYNGAQAVQWANIATTAHGDLHFLGSLTEAAASPQDSQVPSLGWISLWNALTAADISPALPYSVDLDVIG